MPTGMEFVKFCYLRLNEGAQYDDWDALSAAEQSSYLRIALAYYSALMQAGVV